MFARIVTTATNLFPLWSLVALVLALLYPPSFLWYGKGAINVGLGVIMLGMGLTLTLQDFARVVKLPLPILVGVALQYSIMPLLGWTLGYALDLAVGLVLVACCPGGTASNVVSFLARANVALSVTMTAVSTCLAILMTPVLTEMLVGARLEVDALAMLKSILLIVLLPIAAGVAINSFFGTQLEKVKLVSPLVSVVVIILIVGFGLAANQQRVFEHWRDVVAGVVLLHLGGFSLGYGLSRLLRLEELSARTISIEVGMQNSGLGVALASKHFAATPLVSLPSAISAVIHCVLGSICAALWRNKPEKPLPAAVAEPAAPSEVAGS